MEHVRGSLGLLCGLFAVTLAVAAGHRPPQVLVVGTVVRLEPRRLWIAVEYADPPLTSPRVAIAYRGPLDVAVCRGYDVAVTGHAAGGALAADEVTAVNMGRYDPCFHWRCFPAVCSGPQFR